MPAGSGTHSFPLGPWTSMRSPATCTLTPWGTATGFRPMRDMELPASASPHFAQHFTTHARLARGLAGHHALGGGQNADAHPAHHLGHARLSAEDPASRPRDALQSAEHAVTVRRVFQKNPQRSLDLV